MNLCAPFIARPVATSLLAVALLLAGLLGYRDLPLSALPQVDFPTVEVTTTYPGASADTMALLVTASLERQLGEITGLETMTSASAEGVSRITLQFNLSRDIDAAAQDVQSAINASAGTLPTNLPYPPTYSKVNPADAPILTVALSSDAITLERVADAADTVLQPRLSQINGVGRVTIAGGLRPAIRVRADPARLASYALSMEDVRTALASANVNGAKGGFDGPRRAVALGANDQLVTPAQYADTIITWRNNAPLKLSDVATVVEAMENTSARSFYRGTPAVLLDIQRQPGANIVATVAAVRAALPDLQRNMPSSIRLSVVADRTDTIRASVQDVEITLVIAVVLVTITIFLFLGSWRATAIPSLALPLSLIGTFAVMAMLGFALDNLSLMALTVATGFVVDDAIVMIENVVRHIEAGTPPLEAAYRGARQIGFTIVSLTISLIAVFIPLLFMSGVIGRLFKEFSVTLSVAVLVSALISLTLTPMMCGQILRPAAQARPGLVARWFEQRFAALTRAYVRALQWSLDRQSWMLWLAAATFAGTVALYIVIPKGFLPMQDTGMIMVTLEGAQDASKDRMTRLSHDVATRIAEDPAVTGVTESIGVGTVNMSANTALLTVALKPRPERAGGADIVARLQAATARVPGARAYFQPVQDITIGTRAARARFQYTLMDTDAAELARWGKRLLAALRAEPGLRDVSSDQQDGGHQIFVDVDRDAAMRLGVTMQSIQDVLYDSFGQRQVSTIFAQSNQYRVVLESNTDFQLDPASLASLYVPGSITNIGSSNTTVGSITGTTITATASAGAAALTTTTATRLVQVPLLEIASIRRGNAPLVVTHQEQFPSMTISFNLAEGASLGDAVDGVIAASALVGMPASITGSFSGDAAEFRKSLASTPWLIGAAIVVIYIVLGVLYESFIHPVTIISTLPSAGIGALLALMLVGDDLSLVGIVGIVLLMGIVKKNAIMVIDFALDAERTRAMPARQAIVEACRLRFRPIMMTTLAALLGALPLIGERGSGSELRIPLGITIIGGLLFSQFLTLFTTPSIYLAFERLRRPGGPR